MRKAIINSVVALVFLVCGLAMGVAHADIWEGLVAHWTFDEEEGTIAHDSTASGLDGTLVGDPQWVEDGMIDGALQFDGSDDSVSAPHIPFNSRTFTIAMWVNPVLYTDQQIIFSQRQTSATDTDMHFRLGGPAGTAPSPGAVRMGFYSNDLDTAGGIIEDNNWYHITFWYDFEHQDRRIYVNGVQEAQGSATPYLGTSGSTVIGSWAASGQWFRGMIDDVRVYDRALSDDDITELYNWTGGANAGEDQRVEAGQTVTLSGTGPTDATSFQWQQVIVGDEPTVTLADPTSAETTFVGPTRTIGYVLTFRLTVESPIVGTTSDECLVTITAPNAPQLVPQNFRTYPGNLAFRLEWDVLVDADEYGVGFKLGENVYFWFWTGTRDTYYNLLNLTEGQATEVAVKARNGYGEGPRSDDIRLVPMRNYALPTALGGKNPPSASFDFDGNLVAGMNDRVYDVSSDSSGTAADAEDYWGYLWTNPLYFDHVTYHTGDMFSNGGWFLDLTVQYTEDGTTWIDVPTTISPEYDFSNKRTGKKTYARYDLSIPVLHGTGIRIFGTPGGTATFTSISELEAFGDQATVRPLVVQGIDWEVPERSTATLDGSYSFSTRGDVSGFTWEQVSGPTVVINNATSDIASFDAPGVDEDTLFVFKLTAGDGTETLSDEDVRIMVRNLVTTAVAGPDQRVAEGSEVTLDASGSPTTTGNLTYLWTQTVGTPVGVTGSTDSVVTFTAPVIWAYEEELTFRLEVNDGSGGASTDEVTITVRNSLMVSLLFEDFEDGVADGFTVFAGTWSVVDGWYVQSDTTAGLVARSWVDAGVADQYTIEVDAIQAGGETKIIFAQPDVDENYRIDLWPNRARVTMGGVQDDMQNLTLFSTGQVFHVKVEVNLAGVRTYVNDQALHDTPWGGAGVPDGRIALGTYANSSRFDNLVVSVPPSQLADAYAARELPASYEPGGDVEVTLSLRVNPANKPANATISEVIPSGLTVVNDGGGTLVGGSLNWNFSGEGVATQAIVYTLGVPAEQSGAVHFGGTVSYPGTTTDICADNVIYGAPSAPRNLDVEMLLGAHVSWSASPEEGVVGYRIYSSVNGQAWQQIGYVTGTSYADASVVAGNTYKYKVAAVNRSGVEGATSSPTDEKMIAMLVREAEDFNYGGGLYPGYRECPAAVEATAEDDLAAGNDFWYVNDIPVGDYRRTYRPNDNVAMHGYPTDDPDAIGKDPTVIGWNSVGNWWRFTFDVPAPGPSDPPGGWVKIELKLSSNGTLELFWDEALVGTVQYATGDYHVYSVFPMEQQFQTTAGKHTLRVRFASGGLNIDKIGIGFNWSPPRRQVIFEDDFEDYTTLYVPDDPVAAGWIVENGSGYPSARWRLWNTDPDTTDWLGNESPDIAGMTNNYMITDSDLAPDAAMDEGLLTPELDCTNWIRLRLNFNKNFRVYPDDVDHLQVGEVDIRTYDEETSSWSDWIHLLHYDRNNVSDINSSPEQVNLAAYDEKKLQIRWHFHQATYDYWFAVDDIVLTGEMKEIPSGQVLSLGLVGGNVQLTWEAFGGGNYTVEYSEDLTSGNWQPVPGVAWPISETTWPGESIGALPTRYYRVRSE